jgi:hypothetical protein
MVMAAMTLGKALLAYGRAVQAFTVGILSTRIELAHVESPLLLHQVQDRTSDDDLLALVPEKAKAVLLPPREIEGAKSLEIVRCPCGCDCSFRVPSWASWYDGYAQGQAKAVDVGRVMAYDEGKAEGIREALADATRIIGLTAADFADAYPPEAMDAQVFLNYIKKLDEKMRAARDEAGALEINKAKAGAGEVQTASAPSYSMWRHDTRAYRGGEPCPFCGETCEPRVVSAEERIWVGAPASVECPRCRARGPRALTIDDAIYRWNNRIGGVAPSTAGNTPDPQNGPTRVVLPASVPYPRDVIAEGLRSRREGIDDWRPAAQYVVDLMAAIARRVRDKIALRFVDAMTYGHIGSGVAREIRKHFDDAGLNALITEMASGVGGDEERRR